MQQETTESHTIRPLTDEEKKRGLAVLKRARKIRHNMLKRRKGELVPSSWELIRQSREKDL